MNEIKKYAGIYNVIKKVKEILPSKEDVMNELSNENIERMWNDMATLDTIELKLDRIIELLEQSNEKSQMIYDKIGTGNGGSGTPVTPEIEVGSQNELLDWNYTINENDKTILLNYYTGGKENVTVYGKYEYQDNIYDTKISESPGIKPYMFCVITYNDEVKDNVNIKSITFNKGIDTSNVTKMFNMFKGCTNLKTIVGLNYFNTSNVINMNQMFRECPALTSLDLTSFDTSNITNMSNIFNSCTNLTEILVSRDKWIIPEGCTITDMFTGCGVDHVTYVD